MFRKILITIVVSIIIIPSFSWGEKLEFWNRFHLRHNLETTKDIAQPAFFQMTIPDKEKANIEIGVGLVFAFIDTTLMEVGLFADYQKNNSIDKEQDIIKTGARIEWQIREVSSGYSNHSPVILSKINFKNDVIKNAKSIQASFAYTHFFKAGKAPLPNTTVRIPNVLDLVYSPYLGIEYENIISADDKLKEGNILRAYLQMEVQLYPNAVRWKRRLEVFFSYIHRKDLADSTNEDDNSHPLLKAGINLYFLKKSGRSAGIGISYINGEDPSNGFQNQKFIKIAFKVKF